MYLGTEAFFNVASNKITKSSSDSINSDALPSGNLTFKKRFAYGIRVLPGYQVTPDTTAYALLGYVRGSFKSQGNNSSFGLVSPDHSYNANGFQAGFGAMTNIVKNIAVRDDVIYSQYSTKTYSTIDSSPHILAPQLKNLRLILSKVT